MGLNPGQVELRLHSNYFGTIEKQLKYYTNLTSCYFCNYLEVLNVEFPLTLGIAYRN